MAVSPARGATIVYYDKDGQGQMIQKNSSSGVNENKKENGKYWERYLHVPYVSVGDLRVFIPWGTDNELKTTSFPRELSPMGGAWGSSLKPENMR